MVLEGSDRELVEACQRGDREAFRALFEAYKDRVYYIALRFSGDPAAAMDLAQDTFLKLFSCIGEFRGESAFSTWVYRLVVNSCLDHKRKAWRLIPIADELLARLRAPGQPPRGACNREARPRPLGHGKTHAGSAHGHGPAIYRGHVLRTDFRSARLLHRHRGLAPQPFAQGPGAPLDPFCKPTRRPPCLTGLTWNCLITWRPLPLPKHCGIASKVEQGPTGQEAYPTLPTGPSPPS